MSPTASTSPRAPLGAARAHDPPARRGDRNGSPQSAPASLAEVRDLVDGPLRAAVARLDPGVRTVAAYHFGWVDADGAPRDANGGKAVRPALAVLSAQAAGVDREVGIPGALAVELVHNFSLLHDDVMDHDEERRHRPTAWTVFGSSAAILAGDALLALAFEALLDTAPDLSQRAQRSLAAATRQLITGQVDDLEFERRLDVGVDECLEMAGGKTAALMACSASIGAQLAGASARDVLALEVFGYQLGLAFQLVDDLLGIWGSSASTGKPVGADLRARKQSLPVVAAMASGTPAGDELRRVYASGELRPDTDDAVIARTAALVDDAGGRAWAADEAARRLANAAAALTESDLQPAAVETLIGIASYVTARDH